MEHRMDGMNQSARASRGEFSDLIADGLILWRLSTAGQSDLWSLVFAHPTGMCFVLDDDPEGTRPYKVCEEYEDIVCLMARAEALKELLLRCGWTDVDVD